MAEMTVIGQAASLLRTVGKSIKDLTVLAGEDVVKARLTICEACPKLKRKIYPNKVWMGCLICGCSHKKKVTFHGSRCPIGKW